MIKWFVFFAALLCTPRAFAEDGFYTRFDASYTFGVEQGVKNGYAWQAGFGHRWTDFFRTEITTGYFRNDLRGTVDGGRVFGRVSSIATFANAVFDLFSVQNATPYIAGGIGFSVNKIEPTAVGNIVLTKQHRFGIPWRLSAGIGISLPKHLTLDVGYVYTNLGRFELRTSSIGLPDKDIRVQQALIGLRYDF